LSSAYSPARHSRKGFPSHVERAWTNGPILSALPGERERVAALIGGSVSGLADVLKMTAAA
jgi:hypothetical protein